MLGIFRGEGYTKAVDWWSLGVSIYKLLGQAYPFKQVPSAPWGADADTTKEAVANARYEAVLQPVDFSTLGDRIDSDAEDFISCLLTVQEQNRLGYGPTGSLDVCFHPYFKSIDWVRLENKQIAPPPLPTGYTPPRTSTRAEYSSLPEVLINNGKEEWMRNIPRGVKTEAEVAQLAEEVQAQFEYWDYTSAKAVMLELGHKNGPKSRSSK
jgi:serine/threonine protein kinase